MDVRLAAGFADAGEETACESVPSPLVSCSEGIWRAGAALQSPAGAGACVLAAGWALGFAVQQSARS